MKKIFATALCTAPFIFLQAQEQGGTLNNDRISTSVGISQPNLLFTKKADYSDVEAIGSPFENKVFQPGTIYLNGEPYKEAKIRYNGYNDYLEVNEGGQTYNLLRRDHIWAEFNGKQYGILEYMENGGKKKGYLIPLTEEPVSLYFKPGKRYIKGKEPKSGFDKYTPPKYVDDHRFYLKNENNIIEEVRINNKLLKSLFGSEYNSMKDYIKENDLDIKNAEDLTAIIKHYNTLLNP